MTPSSARTITAPAPGAGSTPGVYQCWPQHSPGDALDYSVDFTAWLADVAGESIKAAVVTTPLASGLLIGWTKIAGNLVTVMIGGGTVGLQMVRVSISTEDLIHAIDVALPVSGLAVPISVLPSPPSPYPPGALLTPSGLALLTPSGLALTL